MDKFWVIILLISFSFKALCQNKGDILETGFYTWSIAPKGEVKKVVYQAREYVNTITKKSKKKYRNLLVTNEANSEYAEALFDSARRITSYYRYNRTDTGMLGEEKFTCVYNANGNLIKQIIVNLLKNKNFITYFFYDSLNRMTNSEGNYNGIKQYTLYEYFNNDSIIKKSIIMDTGKNFISVFQQFSTKSVLENFNGKDKLIFKKESKYDGTCLLSKSMFYTNKGEVFSEDWAKDCGGNIENEVSTYEKKRQIFYTNVSTVKNKFGDIETTSITRKGRATEIEEWKYEYEYDSKGNYTRQIVFVNGNKMQEIKRTIEYY